MTASYIAKSIPAAAAVLLCTSSFAADLSGPYLQSCGAKSSTNLVQLDHDDLATVLQSYFEAGRDGMTNPAVLASRSPAFTWANETRLSCGIAYGYLKGGYIDEPWIAKCDCFHQRYISFR